MFHILNGIRGVLDLHLSGQADTSTYETIKVSSVSSTPQVVSERNYIVGGHFTVTSLLKSLTHAF